MVVRPARSGERGPPPVAGHGGAQHGEDVLAVLAGGVDVGADVPRSARRPVMPCSGRAFRVSCASRMHLSPPAAKETNALVLGITTMGGREFEAGLPGATTGR